MAVTMADITKLRKMTGISAVPIFWLCAGTLWKILFCPVFWARLMAMICLKKCWLCSIIMLLKLHLIPGLTGIQRKKFPMWSPAPSAVPSAFSTNGAGIILIWRRKWSLIFCLRFFYPVCFHFYLKPLSYSRGSSIRTSCLLIFFVVLRINGFLRTTNPVMRR